jgi:N-acyl-D-amino-acid deacylase
MESSELYETAPTSQLPHPRVYGTFPRVLGKYVREEKNITLEEAIRKMTSLPARRIGLRDQGVLVEGKAADIVVFNPATVTDRASYDNPKQYPIGMRHVIVNGVISVEGGEEYREIGGESPEEGAGCRGIQGSRPDEGRKE